MLPHSCLLFVLLYNSLFLLSSLLCFFFFTLFFCCFLAVLLCYPLSSLFFFPMHGGRPFYTTCRDRFLLFYPLTAFFFLGVSVLSDHPLVCQLLSHHHLLVLVVPHPITRQRVLFCLLAHHGIPIRIGVDILSHYLSGHAPSDSNSSFPLLDGMSSQ